MKTLFCLALLLACWMEARAQEENLQHVLPQTPLKKTKSTLIAGLESSTTPYINTTTGDSSGTFVYGAAYLNYRHASNLGLRVKTYLLPGGSNPGFYLTSLSVYYANYQGKLLPVLSYTRHILHKNPSVPYSPIQNEVYAQLRWKTKWLDPSLGLDWGFGQDDQHNQDWVQDVNAFLAVSHLFLLGTSGKKNAFGITPTLQLNAGTDRYFKFLRTTKYISQNRTVQGLGYGQATGRGALNRRSPPATGKTASGEAYTLNEGNSFALSNLEANLYLMYTIGHFAIAPSGSLYLPLRNEDHSLFGYWQLNLSYWF